ncbi:sugar transferase [Microbacterium sp. G2-8]|uniref:sugar transferase n=1 Tax=Microbacterium sp. G2-8 TaxID=2842454 RepID=UPI001C894AE2|nr:sugar transferase [Microbacterium sp. G2-8]
MTVAARAGASPRRAKWPRRYAGRLALTDALVIAITFAAYALIVRPGHRGGFVWWQGVSEIPYWAVLVVVGGVWFLGLGIADSRDQHIVGHGSQEYRRIINSSIGVFCVVVTVAFLLQMELARTIVVFAMPLGTILLLVSRWMWRQWLRGRQRGGQYTLRAVALGERSKIEHIVDAMRREGGSGIEVIGAITDRRDGGEALEGGIQVYGTYANAAEAIGSSGADTVIFVGSDDLDPVMVRNLSWELTARDIQWAVAPAITDVAGPRIHTRPVAGLPLVMIDFPRLEGVNRVIKRTFDVVGSALMLLVLSPVFLAAAIAVRASGPGRILFAQERIGRSGEQFRMYKFRSMVADADDHLQSLLDLQGTTEAPLFKVNDDPRITPVGRFLRKHSIDELPQLVNVLRGDMSLVGPRPQRAEEVALYDDAAHRRLLVKLGMSGLWQVSGRSALDWEDALRLDLYYVENWSLTQDIVILFRTIRAVVAPGATAH